MLSDARRSSLSCSPRWRATVENRAISRITHHASRATRHAPHTHTPLMAVLPDPIASLIGALNKIPGIGPRSAERIALHLVQAEAGAAKQLAEAILDARQRIQLCSICGALTEQSPCALCSDPRTDATLL